MYSDTFKILLNKNPGGSSLSHNLLVQKRLMVEADKACAVLSRTRLEVY